MTRLDEWESTIDSHRTGRAKRQLLKDANPAVLLLWGEMIELAAAVMEELRQRAEECASYRLTQLDLAGRLTTSTLTYARLAEQADKEQERADRLESFVRDMAVCSGCEGVAACQDGCDMADIYPDEYDLMRQARAVLEECP